MTRNLSFPYEKLKKWLNVGLFRDFFAEKMTFSIALSSTHEKLKNLLSVESIMEEKVLWWKTTQIFSKCREAHKEKIVDKKWPYEDSFLRPCISKFWLSKGHFSEAKWTTEKIKEYLDHKYD